MRRASIYLLAGMFLHNFPEGMAMAIGTIDSQPSSFAVALAITIHDIPEGICTAGPLYMATGKRWRSFFLSSSTALPAVIGFFLAYFIFRTIPLWVVGMLVAGTAGLMIYITVDELIPLSAKSGHNTIFAFLAGVLLVLCLALI